jgi:hypothetical protein
MTDNPDNNKSELTAGQKLKINLIVGGAVAALAIWIFVVPRWGYRSPCAWLERDEYERQFYVYLFPDGGETNPYRVPARIRAHKTEVGDEVERFYKILYAVMPNGGTIAFDEGANDSMWPGRRIYLTDEQGREWAAELTCDPAD